MSNDQRPPRDPRQAPNNQRRPQPPQQPPRQRDPARAASQPPRRNADAGRRRPPMSEQEAYSFHKKAQMRRQKRKRQRIILAASVLLLLVGIYAIIMAVDISGGTNTFYKGVSVDGLSLNGMTKEQAIEQLSLKKQSTINALAIKLVFDSVEYTMTPENMGVETDIAEVVDEAWAIGHDGNIFARQAEIRKVRKEGAALQTSIQYNDSAIKERLEQIKQSIDTPAIDATVTFETDKEEKFKITPEKNGRSVNVDTLFQQVRSQLDNGFSSEIQINPEPILPNVYQEVLEQCTKRIVRTTTELGESSDPRIHNVKLALSFFNGMVVKPGEEVSFNQTTGPRGLEEGYQNAGVILDDEIVDGPGGGVCQASTTLYQAAVKAGLEIVKSSKHSLTVNYVDPGTDAAVAYDYKDLIFKNNSEYPIFIECKVSGKTVVISIYGYPLEDGLTYEIVSEVYETIQPPEAEVVLDVNAELATYTDETKVKKKARNGVKVRSYRVTKMNGQEIDRQPLRNDYYKEVQGMVYQGVTTRPGGENPGTQDPALPEE